jgi:hypothetical protein
MSPVVATVPISGKPANRSERTDKRVELDAPHRTFEEMASVANFPLPLG